MERVRWEYLEDFPEYLISEQGEVYNARRSKLRKLMVNQQGVVMVQLAREDGHYTRSVALLVARAFLPKDDPRFNTVIHLDGRKEHCHVTNLAWRPRAFAVAYHRQFGQPEFEASGSPVVVSETGERFDDSRLAAIKYGLLRNHVMVSATNGTPVFPTGQTFIIINERMKHAI